MPSVAELIDHLDDLLMIGDFEDLGPNGLQVPADREVERVVTGVTAQRELIERAIAEDAQLVLVHHGLFWRFNPVGLTPVLAERLRPLFKHDVALAGYHLPLDAHPEVGNNALLADALGCDEHVAFGTVGRGGSFAEPVPVSTLVERVAAACGGREPLLFDGGPAAVRRIAIVSGGAAGRAPARDRRGLRRLPHRRAQGARDGGRARGGDPLHRRGPLRHGDARNPAHRGPDRSAFRSVAFVRRHSESRVKLGFSSG